MLIKNILLDLDGTITDSQEGILNSFNYSFDKLNIPRPTRVESLKFLGPPLRNTFKIVLNTSSDELIEKAVDIYRERFSTEGINELELYTGIIECLDSLQGSSYNLYVATSKLKIYADQIISNIGLLKYFIKIFGSEQGGNFDNKTDLVKHILRSEQLSPDETIMIGDRREDISAGKNNGTYTMGTAYGYGSLKELNDAGADYIVETPQEIAETITLLNHKH